MAGRQRHFTRRAMLKTFGAGAFASFLGASGMLQAAVESAVATAQPGLTFRKQGRKLLWTPCTEPVNVALVKGNDRREITLQALKRIELDVLKALAGRKRILIKPNFVSTNRQLAATHVDAIRAILDFLKPHFDGPILVGESTASRAGTADGYRNFGYTALEKEYGVQLIDLNEGSWHRSYVFGQGNQPLPIRMLDAFYDPDTFLISAAKLKTHDRVVTTLSLKNVLLAAPLNDYKKNDKGITHTQDRFQKNTVLHYNMFHLAQNIWPDLAVIDGFEAMEGEGPVGGDPVDARITVASCDALAADKVATTAMGFDPEQILYMTAMAQAGMGQGDMSRINILGTPIADCTQKFRISKLLVEAYGNG